LGAMGAGQKRQGNEDSGCLPSKRRPAAAAAAAEALGPVVPGRVPVYVMMQLDWMRDGSSLRDPERLGEQLAKLKTAGVRGVMADIWWGLCEPSPGVYRFEAAQALCQLLKTHGLELQATMSFHQCGGNVGDPVSIPIPAWALSVAKSKDMLFRSGRSHISEDCISLSADKVRELPGPAGPRTPLDCYREYIAAFATACREFLGKTVNEIQVGMGPCGELRYPSYMMSRGWQYPGVGLVMADDARLRDMLTADTGLSAPPEGLPTDQNALPDGSRLFRASGASADGQDRELFRVGEGKIFLEWYASVLLKHGEAVLAEAAAGLREAKTDAVPPDALALSVKVSGLHWHVMHPSRATEACAGYNSCTSESANAYSDIARMLARATVSGGRPVFFNFTCLEMSNTDNNGNPCTLSAPEDLIAQVRRACVTHNVQLSGENALEFDLATGGWAFERMAKQMRGWSPGRDKMHALTLLRLNDGFVRHESLVELAKFVAST